MFIFLIIILSGFFHAVWNVIAKRSLNKIAFLLSVQFLSFLALLPYVVLHRHEIQWCQQSLLWALASIIIHAGYFILLSHAYNLADVSKMYPIIRGSSSLIVPLVAVLAFGEKLTLMGWGGVVGISIGILLLNESSWSTEGLKKMVNPHTLLALMIGVCCASYVLVDKAATQFMPVLTIGWIFTTGNIIILSFYIRDKKTILKEWKVNFPWVFCGAILAPLSYLMFLEVVQHHQVAQLAPIREIGTVFGVALGIFLLKEPRGKHRLIASSLITIGIICLGLNR